MATIEVKIPAIGDFEDVPIIEVLVQPGERVEADAPLVTLESDKATMDVPAPAAGTVRELKVKVGDRVREGTVVLTLEQDGAAAQASAAGPRAEERAGATPGRESAAARATREEPVEGKDAPPSRGAADLVEVKVPAIGDYADVPVIDVLVKAGDTVAADAPLVTLESDKATMDVPAPVAGTIREVTIKAGDRVSEGTSIAVLAPAAGAQARDEAGARGEPADRDESAAVAGGGAAGVQPEAGTGAPPAREASGAGSARPAAPPSPAAAREAPAGGEEAERKGRAHASPSVRKLARELGVDVAEVAGSGPKGRVLHEDLQRFVKDAMTARAAGGGAGLGLELPPWPKVDFAKFGPIETVPLSRIRKLSKGNLGRNWVVIPHVTQYGEADITELEAFRKELNAESGKDGVKITLLAFLVKACVASLGKFPEVNASLEGDQLVLKRYFHIGFAADTPNGLVVPVVRDADKKGIVDIAGELAALAAKAREGKLGMNDIQGGSFSISSLGGIGGTAFTQIVNAPEVAILGVSRAAMKPVWNGERFEPRLMLPISLSYDHRVIDGALGARFIVHVSSILSDMRRAML